MSRRALVLLIGALLCRLSALAATNIDPQADGSRHGYGENVGWVNLAPLGPTGDGVAVDAAGLTGYLWGENIGWVSLSCENGPSGCSPTNPWGVLNSEVAGKGCVLWGSAWGENVGWINFGPPNGFGGVVIDACGDFNGEAWGENIGWIRFRSDGPAPFKVTTAWKCPVDAVPPATAPASAVPTWYTTDAGIVLNTTDCGKGTQEVRYTVDGGAEQVVTGGSASLSVVPEGVHTLRFYSVDQAGNSEDPQTLMIRVDKTPPSVNLAAPPDGTVYINQALPWGFSAADAVSGVAIVISDVANGAVIPTGTTGTYTFTVTATDAAGNQSSVARTYTVIYPGNIDPANDGSHFAWGENIGWINFRPSWGPGVTVTDTAVEGYAWAENAGWIQLNPTGAGVTNHRGTLAGKAWGENVGWIDFAPLCGGSPCGGVTIDGATGRFQGRAWGENVGWVSLSPGAPWAARTSWRPPNRPPIAVAQAMTTPEDTRLDITLVGTDPDGDPLTYSIVDPPQHGTLSGTPPIFTYSPAQDYNGPDSFTFKASDGHADSAPATIGVTVTPVNDAPVVALNPTGAAEEGSPFSAAGSFADPDADTWTATVDYGDGSGQQPLLLSERSFALHHTYADNGTYTLTVTVTDSAGASDTARTAVTVGNVAPFVTAGDGVTLDEGGTLTREGSFTDPAADNWTATVDYGDGKGAEPLSLSGKAFGLGHTYGREGTYSVAVTVRDDDGGLGTATFAVTVNNVAPAVGNLPGATLSEGVTYAATGAFTDPGADTWTATVNYGDGSEAQPLPLSGKSFALSHIYLQNGTYTATVVVTDDGGGAGSARCTVIVANVAPTVGTIFAPLDPVPVGTSVTVSAAFSDPGIRDTHQAVWTWDDGTNSTFNLAEGVSSTSASHTYAAAGIQTVGLTVSDEDGAAGTALYQYVVVYDPSGGFVTGGGWINSPAGAYAADPSLVGKASFGFVSKYQKGANIPTGDTQFQFKVANLNFQSSAYEWLVVAGAKAQYKGTGTINGSGEYGFMLTAVDGQINGGGGVDKFRIKIWDKTGGGLVYDNLLNASDAADPTTVLGGGSIVIHKSSELASK